MTTGDHVPSDSTIPFPKGLVLAPFRALRYSRAAATSPAGLLCPPYDVIDAAQQDALEHLERHNAVHLILPRDDPSGPASRYRRAARTLREWRSTGVLERDQLPGIYVYEMSSGAATTRGLLGTLALSGPDDGIVLPHENTMPGPVADRLALTEATEANLEPIYLVYDGGPTAGELVAGVDSTLPLTDIRAEDGQRHRLWAVTDPEQLRTLAAELYPAHALIADGHHRYATYLAHQAAQHGAGRGPGPWDFGLTYLVDARRFGPQVEAIHRIVPDLSLSDARARLGPEFSSTAVAGPAAAALQVLADAGRSGTAFVLTDGSDWQLIRRVPPAQPGRTLDQLDVTVAHRSLLEGCWRVPEDLVSYDHEAERAVAQVRNNGGLVLLLNATSVDQVAAVAADGDRMPRKSTLFTPKPATGIVFRTYDSD
jgi:uncharacterized protein (DUF1015 family)